MRLAAAILPCAFFGMMLIAACSIGALDGFSGGGTSSSSGSNPEGGASSTSASSASSASSSGTSSSSSSSGESSDSGVDGSSSGSTGGPSYRDAVIADGPIGYWRLGEANGLTAKDEVGKNNGGYQGGITFQTPGTSNDNDTAISLNGTNARVVMGDVLDFNGNVALSLEAWVNLEVIDTDYKRVIAKRGDEGGYSFFCHTSADGCAFELIGAGGAAAGCDITLTTGQWYHIVGTYDGVTARAYRDGIEVCTTTKTITFQKVNQPLVIGSWPEGGNWFKGKIDEVAIFDKALPIARIKEHYARRKQ